MKVSAIVSAYFAEKFLEGRLANLEGHDVEIVVVCQKDSKEQTIAEDAKVHRIITTPDIPTVYGAWNLGIEQASGEYITSANSDDRHYPGSIKVLSDALDAHPDVAVAYFDVHQVNSYEEEPTRAFRWMEGGMDELFWKGCFLGPMPMWRKELHDKYGYFGAEYQVAGDYEFWMRLASNGEKFHHIRSKPLGLHLEHNNGLEHRSSVITTIETARAKSAYREIMV